VRSGVKPMREIVTPAEMAAIDAEAPEPVSELVERAGWATARVALQWLEGDVYGKRVAVLAGKGNNGADGRSAARHLERRGAVCRVFDVPGASDTTSFEPVDVAPYDLILDACFGTGLRGRFESRSLPIEVGDTPVLAVDIPSGVNGLTGAAQGLPLRAVATVTFAALKPGLLLEPGRSLAGDITVADIGLDCSRARIWQLEESDLSGWPRRSGTDHKWGHAVAVVGGSPGMTGAAALSSIAAFRAGAGYVVQARPAPLTDGPSTPIEAVAVSMINEWHRVVEQVDRCSAVVVGPGLGVDGPQMLSELHQLLAMIESPVVFDAGALRPDLLDAVRGSSVADERFPVLTPHDGEFERLTGRAPGPDRIDDVRRAAAELAAVILLKGPTTVVAHPDGRALLSTAGDQRLATAGTGDVLAGIIGAGLALGLDPFLAAGLGAELHGRAAARGLAVGLTAGDLPELVADLLSSLEPPATR